MAPRDAQDDAWDGVVRALAATIAKLPPDERAEVLAAVEAEGFRLLLPVEAEDREA